MATSKPDLIEPVALRHVPGYEAWADAPVVACYTWGVRDGGARGGIYIRRRDDGKHPTSNGDLVYGFLTPAGDRFEPVTFFEYVMADYYRGSRLASAIVSAAHKLDLAGDGFTEFLDSVRALGLVPQDMEAVVSVAGRPLGFVDWFGGAFLSEPELLRAVANWDYWGKGELVLTRRWWNRFEKPRGRGLIAVRRSPIVRRAGLELASAFIVYGTFQREETPHQEGVRAQDIAPAQGGHEHALLAAVHSVAKRLEMSRGQHAALCEDLERAGVLPPQGARFVVNAEYPGGHLFPFQRTTRLRDIARQLAELSGSLYVLAQDLEQEKAREDYEAFIKAQGAHHAGEVRP